MNKQDAGMRTKIDVTTRKCLRPARTQYSAGTTSSPSTTPTSSTKATDNTLPSGRKPDLWLRRKGIERLIEITVLSLYRDFRAAERWSDTLTRAMLALQQRHPVELTYHAEEILDGPATTLWLADIEDACRHTAADGEHRTVKYSGNIMEIYPAGQRPQSATSAGPLVTGDLWTRVATRLETKVRQTHGGPPAWLRIDDIGMMFHLTDWSASPLPERLAQLEHNINIAITDAPHVRGVILTGSDHPASTPAVTQTAWPRTDPPDTPPRDRLAHGPVAMRRPLPGYRQRMTFILPTRHPHILLPAGADLGPGLRYDQEPGWLDDALRALGHPPLSTILAA
jgi:hypothetical protein